MSDDNNNESSQKPDANAELLAKTDKLSQDNDRLSKQLESLIGTLQQTVAKPPQAPSHQDDEDDLEVLAYKDPKKYARKVQENAERKAEAMINSRLNQQSQANAVLNQLVSDYPELSDTSSDLSRKAIEIYNGLSASEKQSASAYKIAVRDAAAEVGLLPKSKRKSSSNDDFSFGGSSRGAQGGEARSGAKQPQLTEATLAFAEALGLNVNDKKVVERLKQRSQRKSWGKYE